MERLNPIIMTAMPQIETNQLIEQLQTINVSGETNSGQSVGFDGTEVTEIILTLGSTVIVPSIAQVLVAWMKVKENRSISIGNIKINGYSSEEVIKIIREASRKRIR
jgi:hypothetical protein